MAAGCLQLEDDMWAEILKKMDFFDAIKWAHTSNESAAVFARICNPPFHSMSPVWDVYSTQAVVPEEHNFTYLVFFAKRRNQPMSEIRYKAMATVVDGEYTLNWLDEDRFVVRYDGIPALPIKTVALW